MVTDRRRYGVTKNVAKQPFASKITTAFYAIDFDQDFDIDKVDITFDLMFAAVILYYPDIAISLIKIVYPDLCISHIMYVFETTDINGKIIKKEKQILTPAEIQQVLMSSVITRGVRLDVYIDDGQNIINVEMQASKEPYLEERFRVIQAMSDGVQLHRGDTFDKLKDLYIIFFYKYDPTDEGRYRYDRVTVYDHNRDANIETRRHEVILYTGGTHGDGTESEELIEVLKYFNDPSSYEVAGSSVALIHDIEAAVDVIKDISEWRDYVMTIQVRQREAELAGEKRGEQRGMIKRDKEIALKLIKKGYSDTEVLAVTDYLTCLDIQELRAQ
jgi:predicted transposase/invertase (TIGR01784 family)